MTWRQLRESLNQIEEAKLLDQPVLIGWEQNDQRVPKTVKVLGLERMPYKKLVFYLLTQKGDS